MRSALLCTIAVMLLLAIHVTAIRGSAKVIYGVDGRTDQVTNFLDYVTNKDTEQLPSTTSLPLTRPLEILQ